MCPFPFKEIIRELVKYKNAHLEWVQEEPKNAGGWTYAEPRLRNIRAFLNQDDEVTYSGRPIMAAAAVGYTKTHNEQLEALLVSAMK